MDSFWWGFASGCAIPMAVVVAYISAEIPWRLRDFVVAALASAWILGSIPVFYYGSEWITPRLPSSVQLAVAIVIVGWWSIGTFVVVTMARNFQLGAR